MQHYVQTPNWFNIQKVNNGVIILHDGDDGGVNISTTTTGTDIVFDTVDEVLVNSTVFTFDGSGAGSPEIEVERTGFYRLTYGIGLDNQANTFQRSAAFGKIQINNGSGFVDSPFGWSYANNRGTNAIFESAISASTILELNANGH